MRKFMTLFVCLLLATSQLWAQNRTVKGTVLDEKGVGLQGVTISAVGSGAKALTDKAGMFSISVPTSVKSLEISYVGYSIETVSIPASGNISVSLKTQSSEIETVVVTGYTKQKRSQFSGAATVLPAEKVGVAPVGSFDQALQGTVPGMLVNSGSGQPGSSAQITIRGIQSISGAGVQPLFVIDGIPMPAYDMQTINPNDFESFTILKDASSVALYGSRGANGVIVITTKKGKAGATSFQYRSQLGFTRRPDFSRLNLMNTKEMMTYEERTKLANTPGWTYSPNNPAIPAGMTAARKQFMYDSIGAIDIDYADLFFRQGVSQTHEINMSSGTEKTKIYFSAGYFNQEGIDLGSQLTRYTTRFNLDHTTGKLNVNLTVGGGYSISKFAEGELYGNSPRNPFQMIFRAKTYENPYRADGSLIFGASTSLSLKQVGNLLEGIQNSRRNIFQTKANVGLTLAYKLFPTITLKNTVGVDVGNEYHNRYINANSYIGSLQSFQSGLTQEANRVISNFVNTTSVLYAEKFKNVHDVEFGLFFEGVRVYQRALGFTLYNLDPRISETGQSAGALPTNGAATYPQNASSAKSNAGIRSFFANAMYTYKGKYTLNANVRRDGTSRIANVDNKEIISWSTGVTWNALKEDFLKNQNIFTDVKLRASYGISPNIGSIPTGSYGAGLVSITNYLGPQLPVYGSVSYAGSSIAGIAPSRATNDNLKIESIKKLNIGVDLVAWKNRARLSVEYYKNKTVDLFVNQYIPSTAGFGSTATLDINAGVMSNKGFEFVAGLDVVKTKNWVVTLGWNHAINTNTIEDLGQVNEFFVGTFVIRKGLPYGSHYTYNYLGADPATGQPRFETPDGKETFDPAQAGQFAKFGTYLPKHVGGFNLDVQYKAFSISALFSYQYDVIRSNNSRNWITRGTPGYHTAVRASRELITNQWTQPGDNKLFQNYLYDRGFTSSDLEDAKFLRFRNLMVAYKIPAIKTAGGVTLIKSAKFYVQGQNIAIWSPWRGLDPEDNNNISLNEYPNPTMYVVGLDINF